MSAIDDLKNGEVFLDATSSTGDNDTIIDLTSGEDGDDGGILIDSTDDTAVNRVDLSKLNKGKGNHQFVRPKTNEGEPARPKQTITAKPNRKAVEISAVAVPDEEPEKKHESPISDLLNTDDPDSPFSKYVQNKEEEAREWIAEKEEERALMEEEANNEELDTDEASDSIVMDESEYESTSISNLKLDDDIDITNLLNDEEDEEEENMAPANDVEEIDSLIDKTELEDIEKAESEDKVEEEEVSVDNFEVEEVKIDEVKEEDKAADPEYYDAPDIDIEENVETLGDVEIEEDEDTTNTVGDTDDDEVLKHLQKLATEKLKPVSKKLDISSFTVLKKPISNVNPIFKDDSARVIKWVLPSQESIVLMKEFSGSELEKLREYSENTRSVDSLNRRFHMIYDHIVSPKPATFEQWLKTTPYDDIDHYFFAIYIASFKGSNFLPADCINKDCNETFLTDDINIMDMVKFDTKEAKEKFAKLYQSEATPAGKGVYCTEVVPMNDKIAISFRKPSIYNAFEVQSLDDRTRNNYSAIIDYIPYIDTIYAIDMDNQTLTPITYKMYPDNASRTIRSKIQKYDALFGRLSVDEFGPVKAYIRALTEKTTGMRYVYPAVECPKCHNMTEEQSTTAEELVFTRYQLGSLVTTSLS